MQVLDQIEPDEVSPVRRGAIGRRWVFAKSAGSELDPELLDVLEMPHENEGALVDSLRKADVDESAQKAAVAIARLLKGFEDALPADLIAKAMSQGDEPKDLAEPDDDEPDSDPDDEVKKRHFDPGVGVHGTDRDKIPADDFAGPDRTFPIVAAGDVSDAARLIGHAKDPAAVKARVSAIAQRKGFPLPKSWASGGVSKTADDELGATTIKEQQQMAETAAPAVPIQKADGSWDLSGVPEESRGFYESVLKAADTVKAENATLTERVEKAETAAAEANATLREREFVAKADTQYGKIAPAEELGAVLKAAHDTLDAETFEKLEGILKGANERVAQGDLFAEVGAKVLKSGDARDARVIDATSGNAWEQIEKAAAGLVEKADGNLTDAQAIDRVLKTADGKRLYADYLADLYGGVA